jgi:drug/metabolite transporter (DMT)-like permease
MGPAAPTLRPPRAPAGWCLISAALFGASPPLAKALLAHIGPISLAGLLYLGAGLGVLPFCRHGGSAVRRRHPAHVRYLVGAIVFGGLAGPVFLLWGLTHTPAASASLWLNVETLATAGLAAALFREHLGPRTWVAAACVITSGILLAAPFAPGTLVGAGLITLACLCWGLDNNLTALIDGYTPAQSTAIKGLGAGALNLLLGAAIEGFPPPSAAAPALAVGAVAYGASLALYVQGSQHLGATRSQMLFATASLWGLAVSWTWLSEPVSPAQLYAIAPMAAGVCLLLASTHEHEHRHEPITHTHSHRHDDGHHTHVHPGLAPWIRHTHEHRHVAITHLHSHHPDLHHRHQHRRRQRDHRAA